ncbi:MAG TPA: hypothetical protein VNL77_15310 [Roseiflexaceae bacterium]|nr:hypothetical protein [Roseiflexaceae bacterium]
MLVKPTVRFQLLPNECKITPHVIEYVERCAITTKTSTLLSDHG